MQVNVDGLTILEAVAFVLWTVALAGVAFWARRMSADRAELRIQISGLTEKFDDFRQTVAREYAGRDEVRSGREEMREICGRIEQRVNDLYNHVIGTK